MMKIKMKALFVIAACVVAGFSTSIAQDHDHELVAPNGGRLVSSIEPNAEVFVADDGLVQITFLDEEGIVVSPAGQSVSLVGGNRMNPVKLSFSQVGDSLVSESKLPMGQAIPLVVQFKESSGAKVVRERFQLNMSTCPSCEYKEYACACHDD